ncbi:hypothetical protein BU16DRAFT_456083 [Lophium mytilinum]|uniref:PH domain-containing protein n=1 Tax=Lophium mytilinum TaxID=390894 RepID=A0A6A6R239_9PEZI|nr:hypothetical protein BU16DRAFT_456083 [Lophium mytilinum]
MIQTYQPPVMEVSQDTLPELQRIFTFLNSHSNKLYQEGYFLKFHDTDYRGRPAPDRSWQECFAQLVGTVLSLWDASELDQVGTQGDVLPTFINLTDAAITMEPAMKLGDGKMLDNILAVSTAASNKYLFHFNSFNSLTQWTAGIRLAMYEHTTLQEAYTGALIAGKGKTLNNIRVILQPTKIKYEDWARVRFGAGTPWRRCWCVITPPDEKDVAKLQKTHKKSYQKPPVLKGDMKFYDSKKITKKTKPIATVTDAYAAYALYPQSKPLIDQSTLVKIEGRITIHSSQPRVTDGFVFVMPEAHAAVSGFEIMLRFLFPVFDVFALYGRPQKLVSDVLDSRGLMFAMPPDRRYGYLEMWDVVSLIHAQGSNSWGEREWRKQLKELTSTRMTSAPSRHQSQTSSRRNTVGRASLPPSRNGGVKFDDEGSVRSQPSTRRTSPVRGEFDSPRRVETAPPVTGALPRHRRSVSETQGYRQYQADMPSRLAHGENANDEFDTPPPPPEHKVLNGQSASQQYHEPYDTGSDGEERGTPDERDLPDLGAAAPPAPPTGPVETPPAFAHGPGQLPPTRPYQPPNMVKPNAHMDPATLHQLADATQTALPASVAAAGAAAAWKSQESTRNDWRQSGEYGRRSGEYDRRMDGGNQWGDANSRGAPVNQSYQPGFNGSPSKRLPTIPASPYIEQSEPSPHASYFVPSAPPVPEHGQMQEFAAYPGEAERPSSDSSHIHRKPVPSQSSTSTREARDNFSSPASSSIGSLRRDVIDPEALDTLEFTETSLTRNQSMSSSNYDDDAASTSTTDYASTISEQSRTRRLPPRQERPRSGVLRTVGDPSLTKKPDLIVGDAHYDAQPKQQEISTDLPTVDFGPTYALNPGDVRRPGTSGTMTQVLHEASRSQEKLGDISSDRKRESLLTGRTSPGFVGHFRASSNSPDFALASEARTVAWQPGMGGNHATHGSREKLDPEDWVQQRANAASHPRASPVFGHNRNQSGLTPPTSRQVSGDWTNFQPTHQRTPTGESLPFRPPSRPTSRPLSRPQSRGAGSMLISEKPAQLSAREQQQVSRMTGTPLIDLSQNNKKDQRPASAGLVGYVSQREEQKLLAKQNMTTPAMQAEIDRRMRHQQQQQQMPMHAAHGSYSGTPSIMGMPQQNFSQPFFTPSPALQQQQQAGYFPPQAPMQQGWVPQQPSPGQYGAGGFVQGQPQAHTPTQAYGASWDQQQAARSQGRAGPIWQVRGAKK